MIEGLSKQIDEGFLDIGLVVFLQAKGAHKNIRYKSSVVGWKPPRVVIIDMPVLNGAYINLASGCTCVVSYILRGNAYGFETKVIKNINDPNFPLIYLAYPQRIEKIALRKHKRVETSIPIHIDQQVDQGVRMAEGDILDLSIGGCMFEISTQDSLNLKLEDCITISFSLPNNEGPKMVVQSLVKRIQTVREGCKVGVQFIELSSDIIAKIHDFCETTPITE